MNPRCVAERVMLKQRVPARPDIYLSLSNRILGRCTWGRRVTAGNLIPAVREYCTELFDGDIELALSCNGKQPIDARTELRA